MSFNSTKWSRDTALLVIAVFLTAVYFLKEFYTSKVPAKITPAPSAEQTVFEVEDAAGDSKVYVLPKEKSEVKSGSKITISRDGSVQIGQMSGEKHIIFSIPLDINRATAQDFEVLPGIGPNLAERIIETRKRLDGFKTVDDFKKVKGIGDKKFEKIRGMIKVG